jgi:hypothetical protein
MSVTITIQQPNYLAATEQLGGILERHQTCEDTLSLNLSRWGTGVLRAFVEHRFDSADALIQLAQERIHALAHDILIDHIDDSPLENPVLDSGRTWKRTMHREFAKVFLSQSPFDGSAMSAEPPTHAFAQEMIDWMHSVTFSETRALAPCERKPTEAGRLELGQMQLLDRFPQLAGFRRLAYQRMAQAAIVKEQNRQLREQLDFTEAHSDQCIAEMREMTLQSIGDVTARAEEHAAAIQERIDSLTEVHQHTVTHLQAQITDHRTEIAALDHQMQEAAQANATNAAVLHDRLMAMHQSHQEAASDLEQRIQSLNQEKQESVGRLQAQLKAAVDSSQAAMVSLEETHGRRVSGLKTQIAEEVAEVQKTQTQLQQVRTVNEQHMTEIQRLQNSYAQAQRQIRRLQDEVDDSGCSIM